MDWLQTIQRWRSLPPAERSRMRRARIPLNVAESMAFEGEPVDLEMLRTEHSRLAKPRAMSKRASAS